jgi:hypothetical protein
MTKYEYIVEGEGCVLYKENGKKKLCRRRAMPRILEDSAFYQGTPVWTDGITIMTRRYTMDNNEYTVTQSEHGDQFFVTDNKLQIVSVHYSKEAADEDADYRNRYERKKK